VDQFSGEAHYGGDPALDWDYIRGRRSDNRRVAAGYGYLGQGDMCLYQVGTNFHSAQDFYTHTNYIYLTDYMNPEIADLEADDPPLKLPISNTHYNEFREPAPGFVKGTLHELNWYHTAISPSSPIDIELLKDGAFEGYIVRSVEEDQLLLRADCYMWDFFHLTDELGYPQDGSNCEQGFDVLRRIEGEEDFVVVKSVNANVTMTNDTTAVPDVDYEYLIRANFIDGYANSNLVTSRTPGGPPTAPYALMAECAPPRIVMNWVDHSSNEQGFIIEKKSDYDPVFHERARVGPNTEVFEDKNVSPGVTYWYRITAYNPIGTASSEVVEILFDPMGNISSRSTASPH
jgi:hypothetical protein